MSAVSDSATAALHGSRVLVTGASGFLGSHLSERLLRCGADVVAVSRGAPAAADKGIRWLCSAFDSAGEVTHVLRTVRPDVIYHLSGHVTAAGDVRHVLPTFASLLASTVHVLLAATELDCRRTVLAGSLTEPSRPAEIARSPYAAAKSCASAYARMFHALYATPVVVARTYMTYGPSQHPSKVVAHAVSAFLEGRAPRLTSGALRADWIYVDDVIDGMLAAGAVPGATGAEVDLGTGALTSVREVVALIAALLRSPIEPVFGALPDRPDEPVRAADTERAAAVLGWRAATPLTTGLERTIDWHRRHAGNSARLGSRA